MIRAYNVIAGCSGLAGAVAIPVLFAYRMFETLFTFCRRIVVHARHPGLPDVAYLHRLVYKRLVHWQIGSPLPGPRAQRNAPSSPYLWLITSLGLLSAVLYWNLTVPLMIGALCFAARYIFGYARLARFRSPGWLIVRRARASGRE